MLAREEDLDLTTITGLWSFSGGTKRNRKSTPKRMLNHKQKLKGKSEIQLYAS